MNANPHVTDLLSAYLDNHATAAERARVDAHLRQCAQCRADLAQMRYTVRMVRELPVARRARSYTLPETAAARGGALAWISRAVGFGTVGLALVLCAVLTADLSTTMMGGGAAAPVPMSQEARAPQADAATDQARNQAKALATSSAAAGAAPAPTVAAVSRPTTAAAAPAAATPLPAQPTAGTTATGTAMESRLTPPAAAPTVLRSAAPTASPVPGVPPSSAGVATATVTATATTTATAVPTATATPSPTPTRTLTPTASPTPAPTATAVPAPTLVPVPAPAPESGLAPGPTLRAIEIALGVLVLGGLALFLLLRGWRS